MNKELIVNSSGEEIEIALLEDRQLVELHKENKNNNFSVGDIFLGRVKKIVPSLNAAFVNLGYEKDAFLHYLDSGPKFNSLNKFTKLSLSDKKNRVQMDSFVIEKEIDKTDKITNILKTNQEVLIQIVKEPISTKGPRVSTEISLAGRYLVLMPFSEKISISQRIKNEEERERLLRLVQSIKPKNFGIIIRTFAEKKKVAELDNDLRDLLKKWDSVSANLSKASSPQKILGELNRTSTILRDLLNDSFNNIFVNDPVLYEELKSYIKTIYPDKTEIVKLYKGKLPIFEHFELDKQIKGSFGKIISLKSGAYIVLEHTEALHVVDVNSGHWIKSENDQETYVSEVNLEAAEEIARQLRLRDIGGIIVIDFIDMHDKANNKKLYLRLKDLMKNDRAKHTILPPNRFGLVQITRQRVRQEMSVDILEKCPICEGSGEVRPSILIVDEIENCIRYLLLEQNKKYISISVHPFIHSFLTKNIFSIQLRWYFKYKKWIKLKPMPSYHFLEYHFFDKNNEEIKI